MGLAMGSAARSHLFAQTNPWKGTVMNNIELTQFASIALAILLAGGASPGEAATINVTANAPDVLNGAERRGLRNQRYDKSPGGDVHECYSHDQ
jgi:hypothetical protein